MKITVLQGSPHKNGSSNLLSEQFIKGAEENGHEITVLDAAHMNLHPCIGCGKCGMNGTCVHKDDNSKIRDSLLTTDMVVFVTPIYYFGMSAQLKTVIDRFLQLYYSGSRVKSLKPFSLQPLGTATMTLCHTVPVTTKSCPYMYLKTAA